MSKKEIIEFIKKALRKEKVSKIFDISFKEYDNNVESEIEIFKDSNNKNVAFILCVNKSTFMSIKKRVWCLAVLLHEIGHFCTSKNKPSGLNEYNAHKWAYNKAEQLKLFDVMNELKDCIISWGKLSWSKDRIYRQAYNLALKEKFI